jgi:hypothetical protein
MPATLTEAACSLAPGARNIRCGSPSTHEHRTSLKVVAKNVVAKSVKLAEWSMSKICFSFIQIDLKQLSLRSCLRLLARCSSTCVRVYVFFLCDPDFAIKPISLQPRKRIPVFVMVPQTVSKK